MKRNTVLLCLLAGIGCSGSADSAGETPDAAPARDATHCPGETTIFINSAGGTFEGGSTNDPANNLTVLISGTSYALPATLSNANWQTVMECIRSQVSAYNIFITETDPSPARHHEYVVSGSTGFEFGAGNVYSTSIIACYDFIGLGFTFEAVPGGQSPRGICENVVTNILATAGADHVLSCSALPSELDACGDRSIRNEAIPCGDTSERTCFCGGSAQNAHQAMLDRYGATCAN